MNRLLVTIAAGEAAAGAVLVTGHGPSLRRHGLILDAVLTAGLSFMLAGLCVLAVIRARHGRYEGIRALLVAAYLGLAVAAFLALPTGVAAAVVACWTVALLFALPYREEAPS